MNVRKLGYALGAEVTGLDLRSPLSDEAIAEIRKHWVDNLVLCFRDQDLTSDQVVAFALRFGPDLDDNYQTPNVRDPANPYILLNTNQPIAGRPWNGYKAGQSWHSDRSFTTRPDMATLLHAKAIPDVGGDTLFANMQMAFETLSPALRAIVSGLSAIHDAGKIKNAPASSADGRPPVVHQVVVTHPESGRKALYVGDRVRAFVGMTDEESTPLLEFLTEHATRYEFTYRHRWLSGDLLMWDNRSAMHLAISDFDMHGQSRHMLRCCVLGETTGHVYQEEEHSEALTDHARA